MEIGRVLIVSPHSLFAEALLRMVQQAGGTVIARVSTVEEALVRLHSPKDVAVDSTLSGQELADVSSEPTPEAPAVGVSSPAARVPGPGQELEGVLTIIVEHTEGQLQDPAWLKLLETRNPLRRVILLTLQGNEMIVHEQRRVNPVSELELMRVLQGAPEDELNWDEHQSAP